MKATPAIAVSGASDIDSPVDQLASLCKASAEPLRLHILRVLERDSFTVTELCQLFAIRQPALSHHLKVLSGAGLVTSRREGNSLFYRRSQPGRVDGLEALQQQLFDSLDALPLEPALGEHLREVQACREATSRAFFHDNADKFREQQDLIASHWQYGDAVAQVLREARFPRRQRVLEVGPGDGAFLPHLADQFREVIALDNAEAMLERARKRATEAGLDNIRFLHGDTRHPGLAELQVDGVVINMVLHHCARPDQIIADTANCLRSGGLLMVTELCEHDQAWARDACGDLWLGFSPEALTHWATLAGLEEHASVYLAQRNGFRLQVRLFGRP
ncbi:ArsR/SmtB family transcription factor [Haliea atlantica]